MALIENDFGKSPLLFAHIVRDRGVIGVAMLLSAFVLSTFGGIPVAVLVLFAGLNDILYAKEHEDEDTNQQFLPQYNYEEEYDAETGWSNPIGGVTRLNAVDVDSVDSDDEQTEPLYVSDMHRETNIQEYKRPNQIRIDIDLGEHPESTIIIGTPGSGKGILASNVIRAMKKKYPRIFIMGVDPANKTNETGYWTDGFDDVRRCRLDVVSPKLAALWVWECIEDFRSMPSPKLLLLDEAVIATMAMAQNKELFNQFKRFIVGIASGGDGRQEFLYLISPIANISELGFSGGIRSIFNRSIAIVSARKMAATNALLDTKFVPVTSKEEIRNLMNKSPVSRAYFDSKTNEWYSMPELTNHSGYNRDLENFQERKSTLAIAPTKKIDNLIQSLRMGNEDAQKMASFLVWLKTKDGETITLRTIQGSSWAKKAGARSVNDIRQYVNIAKLQKFLIQEGDNFKICIQ